MKSWRRSAIYSAGIATSLMAWMTPVYSKNMALVVGVSDYASLKDHNLPGARNDAFLVASFILDNGFNKEDVIVLAQTQSAQGIHIFAAPTRAAILRALGELTSRAGAGDFIYLHFSGHGGQQPSVKGVSLFKKEGLDEIFLPADIGTWDGAKRLVTNAITDDELLDSITRIRNKGAFVWAVFDSCYSGDIVRGAPSPEVERRVDMSQLGVPDSAIQQARQQS